MWLVKWIGEVNTTKNKNNVIKINRNKCNKVNVCKTVHLCIIVNVYVYMRV